MISRIVTLVKPMQVSASHLPVLRTALKASLLLAAAACNNPLSPDGDVILPVSEIAAPADLTPGETLTVSVTVVLVTSCFSFERFEAERSAGRVILRAIGREKRGVACAGVITEETHDYRVSQPLTFPFVIVVLGPDGIGQQRVVNSRAP